ncbi:MAG TPA: outer membrane beta-barrel protein [Terracidiphilus sp.]|nr:outer membrane beta-barrel protein [Terracidiphilus sp.]
MQMKWMQAVVALMAIAAWSGAAAQDQSSATAPAQPNSARQTRQQAASESQFDLGVSGFEVLNESSTGLGTYQAPKNTAGGMVEARYLLRPYVGFEMTYSFYSGSETYSPAPGACALTCANKPLELGSKSSEIGFDYVASKRFGNLRPFAVGGLGFFISATPGHLTDTGTQTVVRPVFIYGGGLEYALSQHFGIRGQFRDNMYRAPNLSLIYPATGQYTHSMEPMGGVFYAF